MNNIKEELLQKIKNGELNMMPRWQLVLKTAWLIVGVIIVALIAVYLLSFILFALHRTGVLFAPFFGWQGVMIFIMSSPWLLISLVGVFTLLLYLLVSHFSFSYRKPLVYSLIGTVLFVIAVASFIQQTTMHDRVGRFVAQHAVPGFSPLYQDMANQFPNGVFEGVITDIDDTVLTVTLVTGETKGVQITSQTKLPPRRGLVVGETVQVFGEENKGVIEAFGIRYNNGRHRHIPQATK
jgi:hypothetical protein